jgi:hypothetical protein
VRLEAVETSKPNRRQVHVEQAEIARHGGELFGLRDRVRDVRGKTATACEVGGFAAKRRSSPTITSTGSFMAEVYRPVELRRW